MSSSQALIGDSGNEILAKRIIRINRENACHTVHAAILREEHYYKEAVEKLTGLYFFTVSKDEVKALEMLAKKKAISKLKKWFIFPILCLLPMLAGIFWPLIFLVYYLVAIGEIMVLNISFPSIIVLLHHRRLKKLEAKLKELKGGY